MKTYRYQCPHCHGVWVTSSEEERDTTKGLHEKDGVCGARPGARRDCPVWSCGSNVKHVHRDRFKVVTVRFDPEEDR